MPRMSILNAEEKQEFDSPPEFNSVERKQYFDITPRIEETLNKQHPLYAALKEFGRIISFCDTWTWSNFGRRLRNN